jgi:hypothetical protein
LAIASRPEKVSFSSPNNMPASARVKDPSSLIRAVTPNEIEGYISPRHRRRDIPKWNAARRPSLVGSADHSSTPVPHALLIRGLPGAGIGT